MHPSLTGCVFCRTTQSHGREPRFPWTLLLTKYISCGKQGRVAAGNRKFLAQSCEEEGFRNLGSFVGWVPFQVPFFVQKPQPFKRRDSKGTLVPFLVPFLVQIRSTCGFGIGLNAGVYDLVQIAQHGLQCMVLGRGGQQRYVVGLQRGVWITHKRNGGIQQQPSFFPKRGLSLHRILKCKQLHPLHQLSFFVFAPVLASMKPCVQFCKQCRPNYPHHMGSCVG